MKNRAMSAQTYRALKSRVQDLINEYGGAEYAADATRTSAAQLKRYYSKHDDHADRFMPIDIVVDLEKATGLPIVTRFLASLAGHFLVRRPECAGGDAINRSSGVVMKEIGEIFLRIGEAVVDGKITHAEFLTISQEINEAVVALLELDQSVQAQVEDEV